LKNSHLLRKKEKKKKVWRTSNTNYTICGNFFFFN
jgi:hypothetical protein